MRYILFLVSLLSMPLSGANRVWEVGKVLDSSTAKSYAQTSATVNATSTTVGPVTDTNGRVNVQTTTITNTQLLIAGTEYNYVINDSRSQDSLVPHAGMIHTSIIQAIGNRHHGCRFVVNDDVKFSQDKNTLHVIDADGKECSTDIIRQERIARQQEPGVSPIERPATEPRNENARVSVTPGERPTLKLDQAGATPDERPTLNLNQGAATNGEDVRVQALRRVAEEGDLSAQVNLGLRYERGDGVPKDGRQAAQWYRKAAEQGYAMGQNNLGVMYERGDGVPKDLVSAYKWFNLSAAQGLELARANRNLIEKQMSRDQIAEGQRLSREWKPAP
jgi:hypothetical protein